MTTGGRIWIFDEGKLEEALARYEEAALAAYPDQAERIQITLRAMRDFLQSEYADKLRWSGSDAGNTQP